MLSDDGMFLLEMMVKRYQRDRKKYPGNLTIMQMLECHYLPSWADVPEEKESGPLDALEIAMELEQILPPDVQDRIEEAAESLKDVPLSEWKNETSLWGLIG